jgi:hypothetical protein
MIIDDEGRAYSSFVLAKRTLVMSVTPKGSGCGDIGLHFGGREIKPRNQKGLMWRTRVVRACAMEPLWVLEG